jgi:hypothetical protein
MNFKAEFFIELNFDIGNGLIWKAQHERLKLKLWKNMEEMLVQEFIRF